VRLEQRPPAIVDRGHVRPLDEGLSIVRESSTTDEGDEWVSLELVNEGPDLVADFVRPWIVRIPTGPGGPRAHRAMVHGFHSFSGSGSFSFAETPPRIFFPPARLSAHNMFAVPSGQAGVLQSSMFTTVCRADGSEPYTVGTCDPRHLVTQCIAAWQGSAIEVAVQVQLERRVLRHGERLRLPPVFASRAPAEVAQGRWADLVASQVGVAPPRPSPDGYCSWYSHYTKITEQNLLDDLDAVTAAFGDGFELFHVDDGYQSAVGDWLTPGDGFPHGVGAIADEVTRRAMRAGLWVAPFLALARSVVATANPDWLLRNPAGRPVLGLFNPQWDRRHPVRALDVTHPGVLAHLHHVISTLAGQGFSFFKLDFLFASMLPGVRHDPTVTTLEGARHALGVIRDAVGPDAFLLGCGCPIEAAVGTVDLVRTSTDVTPMWRAPVVTRFVGGDSETLGSNVAHRSVLARSFQHRVWFESDPDCLFAYRRRNRLRACEQRLMAHANGVMGGPVMFATFASDLGPDEIALVELARRVNREVRDGATRWWSPDAMTSFHAGMLAAAGDGVGWLAVANVADTVSDRWVDLAAVFGWPEPAVDVVDAARPDRVAVRGAAVRIQALDAHDSVLLRVRSTT
jgi:alpha-galactosidase